MDLRSCQAPPKKKKVAALQRRIARQLKSEQQAGAAGVAKAVEAEAEANADADADAAKAKTEAEADAEACAAEGAKLDEEALREELSKKAIQVIQEADVFARIHADKFQLPNFESCCDVARAVCSQRGHTPEFAAALASKIGALHDLGNALLQNVPADDATLVALARIFELCARATH